MTNESKKEDVKVEKREDVKVEKQKSAGKGEVYIGNKRLMNYVTSAVLQLNSGAKEVTIKARGKYISTAVDVAEVVRNRFVQDAVLKEVRIGSEEFVGREGKSIRVSTIELYLVRK